MAKKKIEKSLDTVKGDVRELTEAFWALREELMTHHVVRAVEDQNSTKGRSRVLVPTPDATDANGSYVSASGVYVFPEDSERIAHWWLERIPLEEVTDVDMDAAARMLAAVGHRQRLAILLALLREPSGASGLVSKLDLGTTGAAYHHLNVLQSAGLVQQAQRGLFSVVPEVIPRLLMILAGLSDMLDAQITMPVGIEDQPDVF